MMRAINTSLKLPIRRRALRVAHWCMQRSRLASIYRAVTQPAGATVIMYHSVPTADMAAGLDPRNTMNPERFHRQMRCLARHRSVITLDKLVDAIESGHDLPAGTVVLTFDDGYLDNLTVVAPILRELRLPAVLYLATGYIDRAEPQWIDTLYSMFRGSSADELTLEGAGTFDLRSGTERAKAYLSAADRLIVCDRASREALLAELRGALRTNGCPPSTTLTWDDVRRLREVCAGIEIGVHTHEHLDMTACSIEQAECEIRTSMDRVRCELGIEPRHFSFPYGRADSERCEMVRRVGLRSAVASGNSPFITAASDPFRMSRIDAPQSETLFRFYTSGAYPGLSQAMLGRQ